MDLSPLIHTFTPSLLTYDTINRYRITSACLTFSYAASFIDDSTIDSLYSSALQMSVWSKLDALLAGEPVNRSENKAVLHHRLRSNDRAVYPDDLGSFNRILHIGIGGSILGPQAMYDALRRFIQPRVPVSFTGNLDPDDINDYLNSMPLADTLFIIVSKSGQTQETQSNLQRLQHAGVDLRSHVIVVTTPGSALDQPDRFLAIHHFNETIGGRYSVTSAVGGVTLSLCFGSSVFDDLLTGAHAIDKTVTIQDPRQNMCLMSALISVWQRQGLGYSSKAIIPYAQALQRFVAHIQQLDCESNGKSVDLHGNRVLHPTGPVIFGEPGTHAQHSFFQLLHQGTDIIPTQFIAFKRSQLPDPVFAQSKLLANVMAQIIALAQSNRPSSLIIADQLTPQVCGALLSFYENQVMFQGFLWNINSFDQPGVELGKRIAHDILTNSNQTYRDIIDAFTGLMDSI